ncbi:acyl-CoA dehydrogenase family protein [Deinococcus wulumuqiensis]|uniref:acyl-CoA dehydrogenase family protein n=1 Tax=Deinococcus wulumuqiensis TaxID=980427 RepID=UPI001F08595F|nr:acyl-CoA dehydrogenase family protein [Deinococcus wulumuqiensis]
MCASAPESSVSVLSACPSLPAGRAAPDPFLFSTFFLGGFECSTHRRPSGRRVDVIDATRHDHFAAQDYARLRAAGMAGARDGLRWHLIERVPGEYDFASARAQVRAAREQEVTVIWDLLHYGFPDFVDPFAPEFPARFAQFARAAARFLRAETRGALWICPVNEISFLAWGGGEVGYLNPFARNRGDDLKAQLVRAVIAAMDAVREVDPAARFLHAEPLIVVGHHPGRPWQAERARELHEAQFAALDMLRGHLRPDLGGHERYLDVIGVNYYPYNQWFHYEGEEERESLLPGHPAHRPLPELLTGAARRYGRPLLIAETGTEGAGRGEWLSYVTGAALQARRAGAPVEGVCLYPVVNHPGWDDDRHCHNGLWDYPDARGERPADPALWDALTRAQALPEVRDRTAPAVPPRHPGPVKESPRTLADALARLDVVAPVIRAEAPEADAARAFPAASFAALRDAGLLVATLPHDLGGGGLGTLARLPLLRRLGRESLPVARLYEGHVNALDLVLRYGAPEQGQQAAQDAQAGELFGVWNTEDAPGVRLEGPGGGVLSGHKTFASGAGQVTRALCPAETDAGRVMVLLPAAPEPGRFDPAFWQPAGMRATVSERVDLGGLRVGARDVIGQPGDYYRQPTFSGGALRFLAAQLGGADAVLASARETLQRLGRHHDDVQRLRFAEVAARLEGAWQTVQRAQRLLDGDEVTSGEDALEGPLAYVSLARMLTEDACLLACEAAERAVGARGLLPPWPTERLLRDLRLYLRQPAPDAARLDLGRFVLGTGNMDPWGQES